MPTLIAGLGYLGEALADQLHASGRDVVGVTLSPDSAAALAAAKPYPVHPCDIADAESVHGFNARVSGLESVVNCASSGRGGVEAYRAVYLGGCRNLLDILEPARFLFTSSTSVYPQADGETVAEDSPAEPERDTGRLLRKTEDLVLASGGIVARLAGIYGPGRSVILKKFLSGEAVIEEDGSRLLNQVHRDDIVSALALLLESDDAPGAVFNVVDGHPLTQRECYEFLAEHFDRPLPPTGPRDLNRKRGWTNKRIANERLRAQGWSPRYASFREAVLEDPDLVPSIEAQL